MTINENDDARGFIQLNVTRNDEGAIDAYELPGINNTLKVRLAMDVQFVFCLVSSSSCTRL